MAQPEARLSRRIMESLRTEQRCFCFKVHGSEHMLAGLPDIIGCVDGLFFGIETKMPGKEKNVSKRQEYVHEMIARAGGAVCVVSSVEEAQLFIARLRKKKALRLGPRTSAGHDDSDIAY